MSLAPIPPSGLGIDHAVAPNVEAERLLADLVSRCTVEDIERVLSDARSLRVLVVGEAIIDHYVYCETMGKAGKEPILAARYVSEEKFVGGSLAVANHVAAVSDHVKLQTVLGSDDSHEDFIGERMSSKVDVSFLSMPGAPTIVKRRYIEVYPLQKLFELYVASHPAEEWHVSALLRTALAESLPDFDVVIVADYGHGMIDDEVVKVLCEGARFLAINTQMNAENRGFNTVSKYPRADYISVSETEIRLEARSRQRDLREIVADVAERLSCPSILVTRGGKGCLYYQRGEGFYDLPALTSHVVDRVGAGDAVLAVTALCAAQGAPAELVGLIGNAVGAQAVGAVGNSAAFDPALLLREFATLLTA
jgi:rfaE bifunctional protein kinase chain/domain